MYYVVTFGKIVEDKASGVYLSGVYFGGIAPDLEGAESLARHCIKTIKGGSIVPKIFPSESGNVLEVINHAQKKFAEFERRMIEAEDIYANNKRKS